MPQMLPHNTEELQLEISISVALSNEVTYLCQVALVAGSLCSIRGWTKDTNVKFKQVVKESNFESFTFHVAKIYIQMNVQNNGEVKCRWKAPMRYYHIPQK